MQTVTIKGNSRDTSNKNSAKDARKEGRIPAVLYGGQKNLHFAVDLKEVKPLVYTSGFKLADVELNNENHRAILKDIQFHPITDEILHIDFLKLEDGVKVKVEVPIRFKGNAPGVKAGGKLMQNLRKIKIKTLPADIVDEIYADISNVGLGQSIRVRDLLVNEGIEVLNTASIPVAIIEVPRALRGDDEEDDLEEISTAVEE